MEGLVSYKPISYLLKTFHFQLTGTYTSQSDFEPDIVGRVSTAARSLCLWVQAMETYGHIFREVEPKKQRLSNATSQLQEKQATLAEAKAKLKEVIYFYVEQIYGLN